MKDKPHKDGVDKLSPVIHAKDYREALMLAQPGTFFACEDGTLISYGQVTVNLSRKSTAPPKLP